MDELVKNIVERAKLCDFTFKEICKKAKISSGTLSRLQSGKNSPSLSLLTKINKTIDALETEAVAKQNKEAAACDIIETLD